MADKVINIRINVEKISKAYLYKGKKGTYLDAVIWFNELQDDKGGNGMIVQSVPKDVYEANKKLPKEQQTRGEILGNCKVFGSDIAESIPGNESGKTATSASASDATTADDDDLPF